MSKKRKDLLKWKKLNLGRVEPRMEVWKASPPKSLGLQYFYVIERLSSHHPWLVRNSIPLDEDPEPPLTHLYVQGIPSLEEAKRIAESHLVECLDIVALGLLRRNPDERRPDKRPLLKQLENWVKRAHLKLVQVGPISYEPSGRLRVTVIAVSENGNVLNERPVRIQLAHLRGEFFGTWRTVHDTDWEDISDLEWLSLQEV